jgi:Uma2 family endonuclease
MGLPQAQPKYTLAEYMAFEAQSVEKHEYLAGEIYAMAGASPVHNRLCFKLAGLLERQLAGSGCIGYSSDQKVRVEAADLNAYPDLTIVCGAPQYHPQEPMLLLNPHVIIEVLSPSTEAWDRGGKWMCYQQLESLTDYLLVSQERRQIEHYALEPGDAWRYVCETDPAGIITIDSINCRLPLAEVYQGIELPPPAPPRPPIEVVLSEQNREQK